ncbi:MAG: helix-hairpin-helix domain-containing protein, partial [Clostridia bacterium]|nr:helix-hairpin-helix domain-containing protein [Clostridia bacterium]
SIGNGTASKESEIFVNDLIKDDRLTHKVSYIVVSEAGASVYSASKLGAEEFPDYDVSERSAVSIARRLQDPLAELIKIDPTSIGVGQYQHEMPEARLDEVLGGVLEDCVNRVGVNLNTASPSLLSYVSGLNSAIVKNIVKYREENGKFTSRRELMKVSKLGEKAYEQCAGFLRIEGGKNVLDNTAVHPESYEPTLKLLHLFGYTEKDVAEGKIGDIAQKVKAYGEEKAAKEAGFGVLTMRDVIAELLKPGRDVRDSLEKPVLRSDIMDIKDLVPGMKITGTVRNVTDFGVFVDIAVHQDGLVHISELSDNYVRHPSDVVKVGQIVTVTVLGVDVKKNRISLSMRSNPQKKQ